MESKTKTKFCSPSSLPSIFKKGKRHKASKKRKDFRRLKETCSPLLPPTTPTHIFLFKEERDFLPPFPSQFLRISCPAFVCWLLLFSREGFAKKTKCKRSGTLAKLRVIRNSSKKQRESKKKKEMRVETSFRIGRSIEKTTGK